MWNPGQLLPNPVSSLSSHLLYLAQKCPVVPWLLNFFKAISFLDFYLPFPYGLISYDSKPFVNNPSHFSRVDIKCLRQIFAKKKWGGGDRSFKAVLCKYY